MRVRLIVASVTTAAMVLGGVALVAAPASSAPTCPTLTGSPPVTVTPAPTPGVDWSGCDLSGALLKAADLSGASLLGTNLTGANLPSANLTGANLTNSSLLGTNLTNANLTGAFVACGTGGVLGRSIRNDSPGVPPIAPVLPSGWSLAGGELTVPVVPCATVSLDVPAVVSSGDTVTLRATLTPATAEGSVEFSALIGLGSSPVVGGVATVKINVPGYAGMVTVVATYTATNIPPGGVARAEATKEVLVASVPGAPTGVSAVAGDAQARVSWTAPESDGGSPVTGYVVQQSLDAGASWTAAAGSPVTGSTTSMVVKSLANGVRVAFRVAAVNARGTGSFSTPSSAVIPKAGVVTPPAPPTTTPTTTTPTTTTPTTTPGTTVTKPGRVAGLKAKSTRKRTVTVRWQAPSTGSPAVTYQYRAKGKTTWKTTTRTMATVKSTKIKKGKKVTFQVRAQNTAGTGTVASKRIKITR